MQAVAQDNNSQPTLDQLQQQIQRLQQQVQQMQAQQAEQQSRLQKQSRSQQQTNNAQKHKQKGPKKKLTLKGGAIIEYQALTGNGSGDNKTGGDLTLDYFQLGVDGQSGDWSYKAEERFGGNTIAGNRRYLHFAQAAYQFGPDNNQKVTGGFFQVPFGNLPAGYQSFWGSLTYYLGFADNQAAGVGYTYQDNGWRFDLDAFKNDDLDQDNTYGGNPGKGYQQYNGGNARLGYDFDLGGNNSLNVSGAVRGGQLRVEKFAGLDDGGARTYGEHSDGSRYAGTLAADAGLGNFTLQGQAVYYKYNIPGEANGGHTGSDQSLTFVNYGFGLGAPIPAKGELYAANVAYEIPNSQFGPVDKISVYENYQYLHSGYGDYDSAGSRIGDIQANQVGIKVVAGPVYAWFDYISGKNSQAQFDGPNDGDWHNRVNLAVGYYFSGDIVDSGS